MSDQHGGRVNGFAVERYTAADRGALERRMADDGVQGPAPEGTVYRVLVTVNDGGDAATLVLGLGERGTRILARGWTDRAEDWRVQVCEAQVPVLLSSRDALADLWLGSGAEVAFGPGWRGSEPGPDGPIRWMADRQATVLASVETAGDATLYVDALARVPGTTFDIEINGTSLESRTLAGDWRLVSWHVPRTAWRVGTNEIRLRSGIGPAPDAADRDRRPRTIAIRRWRVEREAQ